MGKGDSEGLVETGIYHQKAGLSVRLTHDLQGHISSVLKELILYDILEGPFIVENIGNVYS